MPFLPPDQQRQSTEGKGPEIAKQNCVHHYTSHVRRVTKCRLGAMSIWPIKLSDEVLAWLSAYSKVQIGPADATAIAKPHHLMPH